MGRWDDEPDAEPASTTRTRLLDEIARATGRPVADFFSGAAREVAGQRDALLLAWDAIRTEDGRRRALAAVRAIAGEAGRDGEAP